MSEKPPDKGTVMRGVIAPGTPSGKEGSGNTVPRSPASDRVGPTSFGDNCGALPIPATGTIDYCQLVHQASAYIGRINEMVNDSRINVVNKSTIMDMTQRLTSIVSLLAIRSSSNEYEHKLASMAEPKILANQPAPTYADRLKLRLPKPGPSVQTRAPLPCIVAYPLQDKASEFADSTATKAALMKAIKPSDGFQIVGVKKTAKSGVVLRVTSEAQVKKLEGVAAIKSAGLRLEKPKGRRPRILVKDVPVSLSDEQFLAAFYSQNIRDEIKLSEEDFISGTKIIRRRQFNNGRKWVGLELDPLIRKHLVNTKDKLFIDWATCRYTDDIELVRCMRCQQYGHVVKYCTEKESCCAHCAENHDSKNCPNKSLENFKHICATCKRYKKPCDHATGSADCPSYKAKLQSLILNTQYD